MRLLLDTHVLLWWLADEPTLSNGARAAIAASENPIFVSAASVWEISIKQSVGKLDAPSDLVEQVARSRFESLPITLAHAHVAGSLPRHHDDPFDRMLASQALAEDLSVVTRDPRFEVYGVTWLKA